LNITSKEEAFTVMNKMIRIRAVSSHSQRARAEREEATLRLLFYGQ